MHLRLFLMTISVFLITSANGQKQMKAYQYFEEAESVYNDGNYQQTILLLNECLKLNPAYYEAYTLRASAKELMKDKDGALTDYSIFLEHKPDHAEALLNRGILRYHMGFFAQAKEDLQKLLTLPTIETNAVFYRKSMTVGDKNPVMTTAQGAHHATVYNYLGLIDLKLKDYEAALKSFNQAIALNQEEADYLVNRGLTKEALNDSTARNDFKEALRINPDHTLAKHNYKASLSKSSKELDNEGRLTETIESDSTMLYPYLERAQQRFESGFYKGALEDYSMALQIEKEDVEIWLGRGLTRERLKDYEGAFSDYTKAIELKDNYAKAWLNRANVLLKLERYDDAIQDYNVALVYQPDYAFAYYNRAMAKARMKKFDEACADLKISENLGMTADKKVLAKICDHK